METYDSLVSTIALMMGVSWASGVNLYAAVLMLGLGGATGHIDLPPDLQTLQDPLVIAAAGFMYCVEFFADKTPGVDSGWDALHTFIRIPAGAVLAAGAVGDISPALQIAAGLVGASMAATSHATKAGTRLAINTSPEPFTNWAASIGEDIMVLAGLWAALNHPFVFLVLLGLFIALAIWLLPKLWRFLKLVLRKIGGFLGLVDKEKEPSPSVGSYQFGSFSTASGPSTPSDADFTTPNPAIEDNLSRIKKLKELLDAGALTQEEFEAEKKRILGP
ncbi:DUF4126 family protein [Hahella sp. KA22]|uniref:DUF4126 family protein n=1 Tax=Hahella sp. KA22 TaxID=1628392 RepID=UPI000FDF560D|nr:DUF4126 family protein [Hahella sp. KA22]AZZ91153.1 DUF4126 family protein [Hahella sp. KA22]QAY54521.1 DUF4126 family protein [Hahella sp. KA22]